MDKKHQSEQPAAASAAATMVQPLARVPSAPSGTNLAEGASATSYQKRFEHLIGKHQIKNEQLERREDHLLHRLEMLQCSMPAVMLAKVCQQPEALLQLVEHQFSYEDSNACKITPSRHYDPRVREIEAQRKEARRRAEEARTLLLERERALQDQKARVELARQEQQQRKQRVEQLAAEARKLHEHERPNEDGGREKADWLAMVESEASLGSSDLDCLRRLEALAEAESCMRRRIAELEAKEATYMQALARADQIRPQAAQHEREKEAKEAEELRKQLEDCRSELARYRQQQQPDRKEVAVGEASAAKLSHKDAQARPDCASVQSSARIRSPKPPRREQACEAQVQAHNKITWAGVETATKDTEATVECVPACVGHYYSEANKSVLARPEARDKKSQARANVATVALGTDASQLQQQQSKCECGFSFSQPDDQLGTCCCQPDSACNDLGPNAEITPGREVSNKASLQKSSRIAGSEQSSLKIPRSEIETCLSIVNDIHRKISGSASFPHVSADFENLKNIFTAALGLDSYSLEVGAHILDKSAKKRQNCDEVFSTAKGVKEQQTDDASVLICECGQVETQDIVLIGKQEKVIHKDTAVLKCKEKEEKQKNKNAALITKSEKGGQTDGDVPLTCKCEPVEQKHETTDLLRKVEKDREKCNRAVSTDIENKQKQKDNVTTCKDTHKDVKVKLKVDDTSQQEKEEKKKCKVDVATLTTTGEKGKHADNVVAPTRKCETAKQRDDAAVLLNRMEKDKQKCGGAVPAGKEEKRKQKDEVAASVCKGEKDKLKDDVAVDRSKEQKKKCQDIVAALTSKCEKAKETTTAAPTIKCKTVKQKNDSTMLASRVAKEKPKCADAISTDVKDKRKQKDNVSSLCKESKIKLPDSDAVSTRKKGKTQTKFVDATSADKVEKEKLRSVDNAPLAKEKKEPKCDTPKGVSGIKDNIKSEITKTEKETISRAKMICCDEKSPLKVIRAQPCKNDQQSVRDCDSKKKLGLAAAQPCDSDKKLLRDCESKKSVKSTPKPTAQPCKSDKKLTRQSESKVKKPEGNKSKQSIKSCDKSLSRHDPREKKVGKDGGTTAASKTRSERAGGKSLNQLNPSENVEEAAEHGSDDKQPSEFLKTEPEKKEPATTTTTAAEESAIPEDVRSLEACSGAESEYFECPCDLPPCLGAPLCPIQSKLKLPADNVPPPPPMLEELCICEPLVRIVDKWRRREAAPEKLCCGYPRQGRSRWARMQPKPQPRRGARPRRHHPYKRIGWSRQCLGRPRLGAKCACSRAKLSSAAPSPRPPESSRCRGCGAPIPGSRTASLCALLLVDEPQESQPDPLDALCTREKRDQAVLAKLPKPKTSQENDSKSRTKKRKKKKIEPPESMQREGTNRKVARIFEPPLVLPRCNVGPSCTCLKNQCRCAYPADFS